MTRSNLACISHRSADVLIRSSAGSVAELKILTGFARTRALRMRTSALHMLPRFRAAGEKCRLASRDGENEFERVEPPTMLRLAELRSDSSGD